MQPKTITSCRRPLILISDEPFSYTIIVKIKFFEDNATLQLLIQGQYLFVYNTIINLIYVHIWYRAKLGLESQTTARNEQNFKSIIIEHLKGFKLKIIAMDEWN